MQPFQPKAACAVLLCVYATACCEGASVNPRFARQPLWGLTKNWNKSDVPTDSGGNATSGGRFRLAFASLADPMDIAIVWSVQLGITINAGVWKAQNDPRFRADITFGSGGAVNVVPVDFANGTSINIVGHSVEVVMVDESNYNQGLPAIVPLPLAVLTASVAPFATRGEGRPTRTIVPATLSSTVTIPPFARALSVARMDGTLATSNYALEIDSTKTLTSIDNIVVPAGGSLQHYTLPNGAGVVNPTTLGAGVSSIRYIFDLDLL